MWKEMGGGEGGGEEEVGKRGQREEGKWKIEEAGRERRGWGGGERRRREKGRWEAERRREGDEIGGEESMRRGKRVLCCQIQLLPDNNVSIPD